MLELWAQYLEVLPDLPVWRGQSPEEVRRAMTLPVPDEPLPDQELFTHLHQLALEHSVAPGHGGYMAYISGAGTIPGGPAALLAAAINQNVGGWPLGPAATEIETQVLAWFARGFRLPDTASGAFVSGGATANFMALAVARAARAGWDVRSEGVAAGPQLAVYTSHDAHETIDRAWDLLGLGTGTVRRVATDSRMRLRPDALAAAIEDDIAAGIRPLCIVGTAGTTEMGAIDPLDELADLAEEHGCWFHVDAAYGGPAALVDELRPRFAGIERADSITCDAHKWMNTPISSSIVLFRDASAQLATFTLEPDYVKIDAEILAADVVNRYQWTPQFSRPFDALTVWVSLLAHGWEAFARRIIHDVEVASWLHHLVVEHPELEPMHVPELSILCLRYVPEDLRDDPTAGGYLDDLNERILHALQSGGRVFPSNAIIEGRYAIRACLISFRTEAEDVEALVSETVRIGRGLDAERPPNAAVS
ncbi:MAG TPA: pyridoxal-dependent decarboxylase [Acidimicrobiia bacterium]|nr:pyridoxal-dependent decarboxylase [Acidimicrobiia bacterium]